MDDEQRMPRAMGRASQKAGRASATDIHEERCRGDLLRDIAARHGITAARVAMICAEEHGRRSRNARLAAEPDWRRWHPGDCGHLSVRARNALVVLGYATLGAAADAVVCGKLDLERCRHDGHVIPNFGKVTARELRDFLVGQESGRPDTGNSAGQGAFEPDST